MGRDLGVPVGSEGDRDKSLFGYWIRLKPNVTTTRLVKYCHREGRGLGILDTVIFSVAGRGLGILDTVIFSVAGRGLGIRAVGALYATVPAHLPMQKLGCTTAVGAIQVAISQNTGRLPPIPAAGAGTSGKERPPCNDKHVGFRMDL